MIFSKPLFDLSLDNRKTFFYGFKAQESCLDHKSVSRMLISMNFKTILFSTSVQWLIS